MWYLLVIIVWICWSIAVFRETNVRRKRYSIMHLIYTTISLLILCYAFYFGFMMGLSFLNEK